MFKVLIIDDEPIIRKGLKNIINWKQLGCEVCGEASDGLEGKELVEKLLPDIIITDIRMPEIDGLAMIREIKSIVPAAKTIILTGYRDFDYAHEAIKLGAFDFLLKPSKIEELITVITRAVKELKFQVGRDEEINKLKLLFEQNVPILREKLLYDVLFGINLDENEINTKMELLGIKIIEFLLVVVENDSEDVKVDSTGQYEKHLYQFGIINTFEEIFSGEFAVTPVSLNNKGIAFIIQPIFLKNDYNDVINTKCIYLQEIIQHCFGFTVTIAVSTKGSGVPELPLKLKECREAFEHKIYLGSNSIIFTCDLSTFLKFEDYSLLERYHKELLDGVKSGNEKLVKNKLHDISTYVSSLGDCNMDFLKSFFWNTISYINSISSSVAAAESGQKQEVRDLGSLFKMIQKCNSTKEMNDLLWEIVLSVTAKVNNFNNKSIKLILRKALEYLAAHYNEQIALNEVAESVYVSSYYLSRLFKKELGKNFVDYLNEIRIEKAKELLKDVRYKTYEIADMVGIPDAHYFSKLFKKYEGHTPTEFRDSFK